jgi:hypothetical protein
MRCTFEINDAPAETSWVEDIKPAPRPGDTITHDGESYTVQPFPLYTQADSWADLTGTFKLIRIKTSR